MALFGGKRPATRTGAAITPARSAPAPSVVHGRKVRTGMVAGASNPEFAANGRRSAIYGAYYNGPRFGNLPILETTRSRVRYAVLSNPVARNISLRLSANIVGRGAVMRSLCPDPVLAAELNLLWRDWAEATWFAETQFLAVKSAIEGGESFLAYYPRGTADGLPVPFAMRVYESEQVPASVTRAVPGTKRKVLAGIEFSGIDEPLFYYFLANHPGDAGLGGIDTRTLLPMRAERVSHVRMPDRPQEIRALPWLAASLLRLSEIDVYEDAQIVRQRTGAQLSGFLQNKSVGGNEPSGMVMLGTDTGEVEDSGDEEFFAIEDFEPGTFPELPEGMEVKFSPALDAGANYQDFLATQYRPIASGVGLTYEQATGDYDRIKSDRILKIAKLEFQKLARVWQQNMLAARVCVPTWRHMLRTAEAAGIVTRPSGMTDRDFFRVRCRPEGWEYTHPLQEAQTDRMLVRNGVQTRDQWAAKLDTSAADVDTERRIELDREGEAELVYDSNPTRTDSKGSDSKQAATTENDDE